MEGGREEEKEVVVFPAFDRLIPFSHRSPYPCFPLLRLSLPPLSLGASCP